MPVLGTDAISDLGVRASRDAVEVTDELRLVAGHCADCATTSYPVAAQCPWCWKPLVRLPLSTTGTLYSYTVVHVAPQGRRAPYTLGYVDLPENVRLFAHIADTDESRLRPDMPVRLNLREDHEGYLAVWCATGAGEEDDRA